VIKWRDYCFSNGAYVAISLVESIVGTLSKGRTGPKRLVTEGEQEEEGEPERANRPSLFAG
jgi:hypothetical protein